MTLNDEKHITDVYQIKLLLLQIKPFNQITDVFIKTKVHGGGSQLNHAVISSLFLMNNLEFQP